MSEMDIQAVAKGKYKGTTDLAHSKPVAENLLDRNFAPEKPNTSWVADITYVPTAEGWLYLATIMDLYSRKIIGWSLADLLIHSDRGSQYASELYQLLLLKIMVYCVL